MKIILASQSPRRKELLKKIVPRFTVLPSAIDESAIKAKNPEALAVQLALAKAEAIAIHQKNAIVIGADTIVVYNKRILGKPRNNKEAISMLKLLAGKTHRVITAVAVINTARVKLITAYETTFVTMKKVPLQEIKDYVATGRPLDKAGSYGIQEIEEIFIKKIVGDYDNVVGLPVQTLKKMLKVIR